MPRPASTRSLWIASLATLALAWSASVSHALTVLFSENFDSLPLQTSPTYGEPFAFTLDPPLGWDRADQLPGLSNPQIGVPEWKGWSFAREDFWKNAAGGARDVFKLGEGTIAVADPDTWNDLGNPANEFGFYNTFISSPVIDFDQVGDRDTRLVLQFDTSWNGGDCCDDGQNVDGLEGRNNQTGIVRLNILGGPTIELLRWEAAPFFELSDPSNPTNDPLDNAGNNNIPNPNYVPFVGNERMYLDLSDLLPGSALALLTAENDSAIAGMSSGGGGVQIEFGMEGAGDDGWWAVDNIEMASYEDLLGDMDLSGILDAADIDAFALGMLDTTEYRFNYFGEYPVVRGSVDDTFDFEDIAWFNGVMEGAGVGGAAMALARALSPVPEPASAAIVLIGLASLSFRVRQG
ncbi:hypothetical protein MalM25_18550 [Planctomycetes bacterium MalM25]|nr:hypothetical protein MalM25_18550 [Planctomycetes bacterium MalM25]